MKKQILILVLVVLSLGKMEAQQDGLYSQYMFNPFAINPAYAGSRDALSGVLLYRNQWSGLPGAPKTGSFALHTPFKGKRFALGINGFSENIGPSNNSGAFLTYAYRLKLPVGRLAFALRGGFYSSKFDKNQLNYNDGTDQFNTGGVFRASSPSFDFGAYYHTNRFYIGAATTHLGNISRSFGDNAGSILEVAQHYIFSTGAALDLSPKVVFKPSANLRMVSGAPVNFDVSASFLFNKVFWLGASFRSSGSLIVISEFNVTDFMRIGYSYDIDLSLLRRYNSGSHEVFLGFDVNLRKKKSISPRYL